MADGNGRNTRKGVLGAKPTPPSTPIMTQHEVVNTLLQDAPKASNASERRARAQAFKDITRHLSEGVRPTKAVCPMPWWLTAEEASKVVW